MSDTFPTNQSEALAFLYVQNQDLNNKTPEDLVHMYKDALMKIRAEAKKMQDEERATRYIR